MDESDLFEIESCPNIFVDACIRNANGMLMFMSAFGRDTAIKELMARIQLGASNKEGLSSLVLQNRHATHKVEVGDPKGLQKTTGRMARCVFGELNHLWIYRPQLQGVSKGANAAWIVVKEPEPPERTQARVWNAISQIAAIPLLPHWQNEVMACIGDSMVIDYSCDRADLVRAKPLGFERVLELSINQDVLAQTVSQLVNAGVLTLDANPVALLG